MRSAISVENISKCYRIDHAAAGGRFKYRTLRDTLGDFASDPLRYFRSGAADSASDFWALKDVNLDIHPGEVVGIIGRNGAGKSTLLKILSRITKPTQGQITIKGRVGSLLEVGTGFHPELTGRENIYLNGSILGMRRREIDARFDEIVAFAEVEKFLDTPVKRYSSGMHVRLAFAVAAHLEFEILIVDEVLAVGDASFQKRCLGKMDEAARRGRTVLFVSHSMPTVARLCSRAVLMEFGKVSLQGTIPEVVRQYLTSKAGSAYERLWDGDDSAPGDSVARLRGVRILDKNLSASDCIDVQDGCYIQIEYAQTTRSTAKPTAAFHLVDESGTVIFASADFNKEWIERDVRIGLAQCTARVPPNLLAEGQFSVVAAVVSYNPNIVHAIERDAVSFQAVDNSGRWGARGPCAQHWPGVVRPMLNWNSNYVE
jgi:lipopolysaccharide transport system ATP-binding protein